MFLRTSSKRPSSHDGMRDDMAAVRQLFVCPRCGNKVLFCRRDLKQFKCTCGQVYPIPLPTSRKADP